MLHAYWLTGADKINTMAIAIWCWMTRHFSIYVGIWSVAIKFKPSPNGGFSGNLQYDSRCYKLNTPHLFASRQRPSLEPAIGLSILGFCTATWRTPWKRILKVHSKVRSTWYQVLAHKSNHNYEYCITFLPKEPSKHCTFKLHQHSPQLWWEDERRGWCCDQQLRS